jgi:ATPase subunit of ABC transporter with duplicated ATPase domains
MAAAQAEIERQQAKIDKLQDFVDRFGAKATKASAAQSRVKQIQKLEQQKQQSDISIVPTSRFQPHLQLPVPSSSVGTNLLRLVSADIGYNTQSPIVKNVNLSITKGMKLLIRGPNGRYV